MAGIPTTTPGAIRTALSALIEAMTPTHTNKQSYAWRKVDDPEGADPRSFAIYNDPPRETVGGIHGGDGIGMDYLMTIRVSYNGLEREDAENMIADDLMDLQVLIHPLPGAAAVAISGLLPFRDPIEPELFESEEGYAIVDYIVPVYFKSRDS